MRMFEFIFLRRDWEADKREMDGFLKVYANEGSKPFWLVVFPEGTVLREESRIKGDQYAAKNGFEPFKHMLVPRTTGLYFCWSRLHSSVTQIVDVTIGYEGVREGQIPSLVHKLIGVLIDGKAPGAIHMHVRSFRTFGKSLMS